MERSGLDEREREGEKVEERCVNRDRCWVVMDGEEAFFLL